MNTSVDTYREGGKEESRERKTPNATSASADGGRTARRESKFHPFDSTVSSIPLPDRFTDPFHYTPHPLAIKAAEEVQAYLRRRDDWSEEWEEGKMFGVLIVRNAAGETGFLAAFSGLLAGKNLHAYFVPPVYDLQQPGGFFQAEEAQISQLNVRIREKQSDPALKELRTQAEEVREASRRSIEEAKIRLEAARQQREEIRRLSPPGMDESLLIRESQFQKAEFRRLKQRWHSRLTALESEIDGREKEIEQLTLERKRRSAALQQRLFEQFRMRNARGEIRDLCELFKDTAGKVPPAGAGECAAPKLLQYAYIHGFEPLAMAEFWWGDSPKTELRRHGYFYPACRGKCGPILKHMLAGLDVAADPEPAGGDFSSDTALEIVYEDEWLAVMNKPAGLLSVPGKTEAASVYAWVKARYPEATGPLIVHRLDMATSGLLLIAKTKTVHQHLQAQFKHRTVKKRYIALLEGTVDADEGSVSLPLCPDPLDRPRQMVHPVYGKPAVTHYRVTDRLPGGRTRIAFYPQTGRTHQLRVHAAHPDGLNAPIAGDELYGKKADRLYLHAEYLEFRHPVSGETVQAEKKADF